MKLLFVPPPFNCPTSEKLDLTCHPSSAWHIKHGLVGAPHITVSHSDTHSFPLQQLQGRQAVVGQLFELCGLPVSFRK